MSRMFQKSWSGKEGDFSCIECISKKYRIFSYKVLFFKDQIKIFVKYTCTWLATMYLAIVD